VTSDYLIYYDVTNLVKQNNQVSVTTSDIDSNFDGRIKLINLIVAYNDGDSDVIKYWINGGHDTSTYNDDSYIGHSNFNVPDNSNINKGTLQVIQLSSIDGIYTFNGLKIPSGSPQGSYSGTNTWDITDKYRSGINELTYDRTSTYYKILMAFLTIEYDRKTDLMIESMSIHSTLELFHNYEVQVKLANRGNFATGPFTVKLYDQSSLIGSQYIQNLNSNSVILKYFSWKPTFEGIHQIRAVIDANNEVKEVNENNNIIKDDVVVSKKPISDLTISNLKTPTKTYLNTSSNIYVQVKNEGTSSAGSFHVKLYDNNKLVSDKKVNNLNKSAIIVLKFIWNPKVIGNHILKVYTDAENQIMESRETNNQISRKILTVKKLPDLTPIKIETSKSLIKKLQSVKVIVENRGLENSSSGKITLYDGKKAINTLNLGLIKAGESFQYMFKWKPTTVGQHIIRAVVDPTNQLVEENKTNNLIQKVLIIKDTQVINIFMVSDNPGVSVLNMASYDVLNKYPDNVAIQLRSNDQIQKMSTQEIQAHLISSDIFIANWLSTEASEKIGKILDANPEIAQKKVFLILETDSKHVNLMKYSTINGKKLLKNYSTNALLNYREKTSRGTNYSDIIKFLGKQKFPSLYNSATLYKSLDDKENIKNEILWALNLTGFKTSYQNPKFYGNMLNYGIYRYKWFSNIAGYSTIDDYKKLYFKNGQPCVGVIESTAYLKSQNLNLYYSIIHEMEEKGLNVIPILAAGGSTDQLKVMVEYFTNAPDVNSFLKNPSHYTSQVNAIVEMQAYGIGGDDFTETTSFFTKLNVPIIRAVHSDYMANEEWKMDSKGLSAVRGDRWWHIAILEAQGIIEPTFIGGQSTKLDLETGAAIIGYVPEDANIARMASRIKNWARLKYLANKNKDLALIYYNYPPGKNNIGASYLDTIKSIYNILYSLKEEGYQVENLPKNEDELLDMILERGINIANWAPGELKKLANNPNTILYPVEDYQKWFNKLDKLSQIRVKEGPVAYIGVLCLNGLKLKQNTKMIETIKSWESETAALAPDKYPKAQKVIKKISQCLQQFMKTEKIVYYNQYLKFKKIFIAMNIEGLSGWGEAPGNIMVVTRKGKKYFVLPGLKFGKVFIGPQPQRGWEGDVNQLYHNSVVPPHHQYLAFYAYLQQQGTDAMIYLGRHATHEWLPGKEVLLSSDDFPSIITGDVPQVYYYIVDGLAEGEQAKRRGSAVIIDHLTSPMTFTKLYGGLSKLAILTEQYKDANQKQKLEIIGQIRKIIKQNNLEADMGINVAKVTNYGLISVVNSYLSDVQSTLYPYGLHTIGEKWSDDKIALMVTSMLSVPFEVKNNRTTSLHEQISLIIKAKSYNKCSALEKQTVQNKCVSIVKSLVHNNVNDILLSLDRSPSDDLRACLVKAKNYINTINMSTNQEINSLLNALNGGYVAPGTGADPVANSDALATGKNFYHDQSAEIPTLKAYQYGGTLVLLSLEKLTDDTEKIVMGIWCVETARDDGALVSMVLQLLGMEPQWSDSPSAGLNGQKLKEMPKYLELEQLIRPKGWEKKRIDVTIITSGLFRDLYSRQAILIDKSFRVALARSYNTIISNRTLKAKYGIKIKIALNKALKSISFYGMGNESLDVNYVAKHWVEDIEYYLKNNLSPELAGEMAISRIFAPPEGDYGAGIAKAAELSWTWKERMEMANYYLKRMGHIYSENNWGTSNSLVFSRALSGTDSVFTSRNTNLYGVLDNDDFFDYWGGLSMTMEKVNGNAPDMYVLSYANRASPKAIGLEQYMNREMTSRYFNPSWIKGMMSQGYDGGRYISRKFASNLWGWQVTRPGMVQEWMWDEITNTYLRDKYNLGVNTWLSEGNNAYSMISITGTLLTAAYSGNWHPDSTTMNLVANKWAQTVIQNGVACCDCSCGNIAMIRWATNFVNPDLLSQVNNQMYQATQNSAFSPGQTPQTSNPSQSSNGNPSTSQGGSQGAGSSGKEVDTVQSQDSTSPGDQGQGKSYEVSKSNSGGSSESGLPITAIIGVIVLVALVGVGYYRGIK
jgi:cobaltochelatase CobN